MKVDEKTVKKIANLAKIEVTEQEIKVFEKDLTNIFNFIEKLNSLKVEDIVYLSSNDKRLFLQKDEVIDGGYVDDLLSNTKHKVLNCFVVPKVVEND
jgi:aspartyl-tRNA(Asn)/glutamyl-tRNA(Gln) amidotransferase subunit C